MASFLVSGNRAVCLLISPNQLVATQQPSPAFAVKEDRPVGTTAAISDLYGRKFLLELVATRDIPKGQELLLDYGKSWQNAWIHHIQTWIPPHYAEQSAPSYVHTMIDDAIAQARTENELRDHPYPEHVFTSCFFPAQNFTNNNNHIDVDVEDKRETVTTVQWENTRGIMFEYANLRPCRVLERQTTLKRFEAEQMMV
jgi:hypothetical protein